jgi:hypothetical protein
MQFLPKTIGSQRPSGAFPCETPFRQSPPLNVVMAVRWPNAPTEPGGAWSDYCRYPLMWLGHPDPATALLEQVHHDPDGDALSGLMTEWYSAFASTPTTVRKAVDAALNTCPDLLDAMREFPVEDRGEINRSKLGWLLKKNANRIVGDFEFQKAEADGRTAWRVVKVETPPLPPSPSSGSSVTKTVNSWSTTL